jgi:hypothetical protein
LSGEQADIERIVFLPIFASFACREGIPVQDLPYDLTFGVAIQVKNASLCTEYDETPIVFLANSIG